MSRLLGLVGGISDRNHMWEICSIFRLFTSSAGSLGESHFKKKKISSSNTLAAARLWRGHRPLGVQKRKVHAPGYGYSGRQAWGGASTFPVVQLITVLLFIDFLSQNSTLKKKSHLKARRIAWNTIYTRVQWLPMTQYFGPYFILVYATDIRLSSI